MSYPPTHDAARRLHDDERFNSRSSADLYASVPTQDAYDGASTPPPHFVDDNHYPIRRDSTMGSFGMDSYRDPYGSQPYAGPASTTTSFANLADYDGSQIGLNTFGRDGQHGPGGGAGAGGMYGDKYEDETSTGTPKQRSLKRGGAHAGAGGFWSRLSSKGRKMLIVGAVALLLVIIIAVAVPAAVVTTSRDKSESTDNNQQDSAKPSSHSIVASAPSGVPTGGSDGGNVDWRTAAVGGDGSTVYMEDGTSFIYNNTFGGFWNAIPFNDSAKAQADMPALNEPWDYSKNLISGVNIGGWLTIEPFIVPGLFEPFNPETDSDVYDATVIDEWTLCEALGSNMSAVITEHYETFITEKDFAQIAGAGLNWVRIPIPWWIIEVYDGEPFLANVGWSYFLKALTWARKYGLRVNLDLHAVPGSQNGYNHSGKQGSINLLNGVMGIANTQRTMNYIRTLTEFISQDQYKNLVPMFSILNEPYAATIGVETLRTFYYEVYTMIREITGYGEGNGPWITFHDGFTGTPVRSVAQGGWLGWLPGMDRVALDTHPYLCFAEPNNDGITYQAAKPCSYWAGGMNQTSEDFGYYMAAEWSLAFNDCGKWLNNVGNGQRFEGTYYVPGNTTAPEFSRVGSCEPWTNYPAFNQSTKDGLKLVAAGHMDAFRNWFYWTWKIGYSDVLGMVANPVWSYSLGLQEGWMPENPREVVGACTSLVSENGFTVSFSTNPAPTLSAWMTGGQGAGTIQNTAMLSSYTQWPPASLGTTPVSNLPTYTQTQDPITLPISTPTSYPSGYSTRASPGDGWFNNKDSSDFYTPVEGCSYPNPWSGVEATIPRSQCEGDAARVKRTATPSRRTVALPPTITPSPAAARRH
ncbi:hypothetical protein ACM66B_006360 [Microbotryomycetes sp. NB124-2]